MNRRQFLVGLGGAGLAGCTSGDDASTETAASPRTASTSAEGTSPPPTPTPTSTGAEEPPTPDASGAIARSAWFELVSVDAPDEVELGTSYTLSFSVRNVGKRTRTFSTSVVTGSSDPDAWTATDPRQAVVGPGETVTLESRPFTARRLGTVHHRLTAFSHRIGVEVVARRLPLGAGYTTPTGVLLTVLRTRFAQSFEYSLGGYVYEEPAPAGKTWAFATVYAENTASSTETLPFKVNFSLLEDGSRHPYVRTHAPQGQYNGGRVPPGTVREGWIVFAVPASVEADDLAVAWTDNAYDATLAVHWEA